MTPNPSQTSGGAVADSDAHSLSVGANGPLVLHDVHLVETLAHFNRENVVERRPHAKGAGAFGRFTVTHDVSSFTKAAVFQPGTETKTLLRFSTVAGELGSPDTWRDVRGFSLRFYTTEGNYDLVGNNTPVFFLRDPIKFPHFIRSQKRLPSSGLRDNTMQWDFWTLSPESAHQVTYLMGDRGLPKTWRNMNGYGSHTYMWVNAAGERFWVKYHFHTQQGMEFLTNEEAATIAGQDADFHRRDLFEAIEAGDFPEWELSVQLFTDEDAQDFPFDHLDPTKLIPEELIPLQPVGRMVLNRWPDNFFAETEQVAFCPANVPPGIDFSNDPLLQGRLFSYLDTQLSRLGGPNFAQIPINAPKCPFHNMQRDGHMQMQVPKGRVNYEPSSLQADSPRASQALGFRHFA